LQAVRKFIRELQKRNVVKAGISYLVLAFALLEASDILFPLFKISTQAITYVLVALAAGFPAWLIFAYIYEWTPHGFQRTDVVRPEESIHRKTGKRLNAIIIGSLSLAIILLVIERFYFSEFSSTDEIRKRSIAVLPFENKGNETDAYFSQGITEDIITQLAKLENLRVVPRIIMRDYNYEQKTLQQIGNELRVGHLLVGSVRRSGDDIRINCQLVETENESEKWADSYDRQLDDIFEIQAEVAQTVAKNLKREFTEAQIQELKKKPTENLLAYTLYLKGYDHYKKYNASDHERAIDYFKLALKEDSSFTELYGWLSDSYAAAVWPYGIRSYDYLDSALILSDKGIEQNDQAVMNWLSKSRISWLLGDNQEEEYCTQRALELDPNNLDALLSQALIYTRKGHMVKAIRTYENIIQEEPLWVIPYSNIADIYITATLYDDAERMMQLARSVKPDWSFYYINMTELSILNNKQANAAQFLDTLLERSQRNTTAYETYGHFMKYIDIEESKVAIRKGLIAPNFDSSSNSYTLLAQAHFLKEEGFIDSAKAIANDRVEFFKQELEKNRGYDWSLGVAYALLDQDSLALTHLQTQIDKYPGSWKYGFVANDPFWSKYNENKRYLSILDTIKRRSLEKKEDILKMNAEVKGDRVLDIFSD
jgi:TolB-like protein